MMGLARNLQQILGVQYFRGKILKMLSLSDVLTRVFSGQARKILKKLELLDMACRYACKILSHLALPRKYCFQRT